MVHSRRETSQRGVMVVRFIKKRTVQDDEYNYHDSLQACLLSGIHSSGKEPALASLNTKITAFLLWLFLVLPLHPKRYVESWKTAETPWIQNPEFILQSETTRHLRPFQLAFPPGGENIWGQNMLWWTPISNTCLNNSSITSTKSEKLFSNQFNLQIHDGPGILFSNIS